MYTSSNKTLFSLYPPLKDLVKYFALLLYLNIGFESFIIKSEGINLNITQRKLRAIY